MGDKKLPQEFGIVNLTLSLTKSASIGYFSAFFAFISRYVMQNYFLKAISEINNHPFDENNYIETWAGEKCDRKKITCRRYGGRLW